MREEVGYTDAPAYHITPPKDDRAGPVEGGQQSGGGCTGPAERSCQAGSLRSQVLFYPMGVNRLGRSFEGLNST